MIMKNRKLETDLFRKNPNAGKNRGWFRICLLVMLLLAAALLAFRPGNWPTVSGDASIGTAPDPAPAPTLAPESLTARQTREAAYEKDLAKLEKLLENNALQEETRQQAASQLARMIDQHQLELGLEEALTNAGFAPCLVLMQNDALTVAVSASEVTAAQSAVILSICLAHTEVAAENIRIMPGGL